MKLGLILCLFVVLQDNYLEVKPFSDNISFFSVLERWPMYPNGIEGIDKYVVDNLVYPSEAKIKNIQGDVKLVFLVTKSGKVDSLRVINDVDILLANEAKRIFLNMNNWKPGIKNGQPINVSYSYIVNFQL